MRCHYSLCHCAQRRILFIVMLNVIMLSSITLIVVAPIYQRRFQRRRNTVGPTSFFRAGRLKKRRTEQLIRQ
jgi:hypothetical protein